MQVALFSLVAGVYLRPADPQPHVLSSHTDAFGGLLKAVREGEGACSEYVASSLKEIAATYTHVQVPHVLSGVCARGTFFHAFKDKEECNAMTKKLVEAHDKDGPYDDWCAEVAKLVGESGEATEETAEETKEEKKEEVEEECKCMALPDAVPRDGEKVKATDGTLYMSSYGAECAAHDLETDACSGEYKAAWCYEKWCYVSPGCKQKDIKESFYFGADTEMKYSYNKCGGMDAFAGEACAKQSQDTCESFSSNCAWNGPSATCQNKLCQCTGSNNDLAVAKFDFAEGYGESCKAWDKDSCAGYEKLEGDFPVNLGLWCCKDWCYVSEECPSAKPSAVGDGLFYSYFACPDDPAEISSCKWTENVDFGGAPVPLSSDAAAAVSEAVEEAPPGF